jgi:hypothetical protein
VAETFYSQGRVARLGARLEWTTSPRWTWGKPNRQTKLRVGCQVSLRRRDTQLLAAMLYEGYSPFSQTVRELTSIGAPTLESCSTLLWLADRIRNGWTIPAADGGLNLGVDVDVVRDRATAS